MKTLEFILDVALLLATVARTVRFYVTVGAYDKYLNYGILVLCAFLALFGRKMSQPGLLIFLLCTAWASYLIATNAFVRCNSLHQFRQLYRRNYILVITYIVFLQALTTARLTFYGSDVIYASILLVLLISFWTMLAYPPGLMAPYQRSLTVQAMLWVVLVAMLSEGSLYEWSRKWPPSGLTWKIIENGKINLQGLNTVCDGLVSHYAFGIVLSGFYLLLVLIYHKLVPDNCRKAVVHAYMLLLGLNAISGFPSLREPLSAIPGVGKYIGSCAFVLFALLASFFVVLSHLVTQSRDEE